MKRSLRLMLGRPAAVRQRAKPSAPAGRTPLRGLTAGLTALATLAAAAVLVVLPAGTAQATPLRSTPLITYNLQGADSGQDSKWASTIAPYFIPTAQIVAVQEAGPTPPGVEPDSGSRITVPGLPQTGRAGYIQHRLWQHGHDFSYVYFLQTDRNGGSYEGGRNNVALVTRSEPDEVWAVPNPEPRGRAALGVRFGDNWYFTFHGRSLAGRPNDSEDMVRRIANFATQQGRQWTVAGDFNMQPGNFPIPAGSQLYNTGEPTHQNGEEYDYAVASENIADHPVRRRNAATSDHTFAVQIGGPRAAAEPRSLFTSPRYIESMQNGGVLDAWNQGTDHGTPITTYRRTGRDNQKWDIEFDETDTVRIRQVGGRCITAVPDKHFRFRMILDDCSDSPAQRWKLISLGNEQYQIRNTAARQCMDVRTTTDPRLIDFRLQDCAETDGQNWFLAPPYDAIRGPNFETADLPLAHEGSEGLENLQTGRMLARNPGSANALRAYPHRTTPVPNQEEWRLEWAISDRRLLRLRDPISNRCATVTERLGQPDDPFGVSMKRCNWSRAQTWQVEPAAENFFRLRNTQHFSAGNPCLSVEEPDPQQNSDLVNATDCDYDPSTAQRWFFAPFSTATE